MATRRLLLLLVVSLVAMVGARTLVTRALRPLLLSGLYANDFLKLRGTLVHGAAYSPDGTQLLTVEESWVTPPGSNRSEQVCALRLRDAGTGKELRVLETGTGYALPPLAEFTSDGKHVAFAVQNGALQRYTLATGERTVLPIAENTGGAFTRRGDVLAQRLPHEIRLVSVANAAPIEHLPAGVGPSLLLFSPDGRWLCWEEQRGNSTALVVYDRETQHKIGQLPVRSAGEAQTVAFSLDSASLITTRAVGANPVIVYSLTERRIVAQHAQGAGAGVRLAVRGDQFVLGQRAGDQYLRDLVCDKQGCAQSEGATPDAALWVPDPPRQWVLRSEGTHLWRLPYRKALTEAGFARD